MANGSRAGFAWQIPAVLDDFACPKERKLLQDYGEG